MNYCERILVNYCERILLEREFSFEAGHHLPLHEGECSKIHGQREVKAC